VSNANKPTTGLCYHTAQAIYVRGADLVDELIGRVSFTEMMLWHWLGQRPAAAQTALLDAVLVTLMEHGVTPSAIASRLIYDSAPDALQAAVAAGLLGVGSTFIGTMEGCAVLLDELVVAPDEAEARAAAIAARFRDAKRPIPGFGHPIHKPDDPRSARLLELCQQYATPGHYVRAVRCLAAAVDAAYGRHITINATGAIAAVLGEIKVPRGIMRGVAVVSRSAGLVGHILEEQQRPAARHLWELAEREVTYDGPLR
jgi:citrate synthase